MAGRLLGLVFAAGLLLAAGCADLDAPVDGAAQLSTEEGALSGSCGGPDDKQCTNGRFCERRPGACDSSSAGACVSVPKVCPRVYAPVCGCDGKTYQNDCKRLQAGMTKVADGVCPAPCGGIMGVECPRGQMCLLPDGMCSSADMQGLCVKRPFSCAKIWAPVCGCDGQTYGNECELRKAQVSKDHDGACCDFAIKCQPGYLPADTDGDGCDDTCKMPCKEACDCYDAGLQFSEPCEKDCMTCDNFWSCDAGFCAELCGPVPVEIEQCFEEPCTSNMDCGKSRYCKQDSCGTEGICTMRPLQCPDVWAPVCGCDGVTYGNFCEAEMAGATVATKGECSTKCGGIAGLSCPKDETCDLQHGACGMMDPMGVCVPTPDACPKLWAPVCDCTGKTWPNDCERLLAGAQLAHEGECKADPCAPQDAMGEGFCDMWIGVAWNGKECVGVSGCSCVGSDCGSLYGSFEECGKATANCGPCKPLECPWNTTPVDTDGDGCDDTCQCSIAIDCMPGYAPYDKDGDGCNDGCKPICEPLSCPVGEELIDADGDGCGDTCVPLCKKLLCSDEQWPVDTDGDGCDDSCQCMLAIDCLPGYLGVDSNGDGCIDGCKPFCKELICQIGETAVDSDGDGCPDVCKASCKEPVCPADQ